MPSRECRQDHCGAPARHRRTLPQHETVFGRIKSHISYYIKSSNPRPARGLAKNFIIIMAKLIVNGEDQEVQLPATVADLIQQNNVAQPDMVSVQMNEEFVDREDFATLQLNEGDTVDFLYFMGGGQDKESIEYRF